MSKTQRLSVTLYGEKHGEGGRNPAKSSECGTRHHHIMEPIEDAKENPNENPMWTNPWD